MILFFLPSFPFSAGFLTQRERAIAQARLNRDQRPQSHGGMSGGKGILNIITDIHAWMFTVLYASCKFICTITIQPPLFTMFDPVNVGVATISYFLPTVSERLYIYQ